MLLGEMSLSVSIYCEAKVRPAKTRLKKVALLKAPGHAAAHSQALRGNIMTTSVHEHPFDSTSFRKALSRFATGIAVVSVAADDNGPAIGLTINSFSSVSLEPPLVLWCLDKHSDTAQRFLRSPHFAVSLLKAEHGELSKKLAKPGKHELDVETEVWQTGAPILKDALAAFDCTVEHR